MVMLSIFNLLQDCLGIVVNFELENMYIACGFYEFSTKICADLISQMVKNA